MTSAPSQETNPGAEGLALLAQPLPTVTLSALEGLNYTTTSWAQPSYSPVQMHQAAGPDSSRTSKQGQLQQSSRGDPAAPRQLQAQRGWSVPSLPSLLCCRQPHSRALPGNPPRPGPPPPCGTTRPAGAAAASSLGCDHCLGDGDHSRGLSKQVHNRN